MPLLLAPENTWVSAPPNVYPVYPRAELATHLRHAARKQKTLFWEPIVFAGLFLALQSDSRVWSSRQAPLASDWSASSWCERLCPINARQSTVLVRGWRRERRGRLRRAGGGRGLLRWPRLLALADSEYLDTGERRRYRQVSLAFGSRQDGVREVSRPPGGVLQSAAIPHGRPAEVHTKDGPGRPSIPVPSRVCGRRTHRR